MNITKQGINQFFNQNQGIVIKTLLHQSLIFPGQEYEVFNLEKNDPHILLRFTSTTQGFQLCNTTMRSW